MDIVLFTVILSDIAAIFVLILPSMTASLKNTHQKLKSRK